MFSSSLSRLILVIMLHQQACTAWMTFSARGSKFVPRTMGGKATLLDAASQSTIATPEKPRVRGILGSHSSYNYSLDVQ